MKKLIVFLISVFLLQTAAFSQVNANKLRRKASRSLSSYFIDQVRNSGELDAAKSLIDKAVQSGELTSNEDISKAYVIRGQIYNTVAARLIARLTVGKGEVPDTNPAYVAYESFMTAYDYAEKSWRREDVYDGLGETAAHLTNMGNLYIRVSDYKNAYKSLNAVLELNKFLMENGQETVFKKEENLNNQKFVVAVYGMQIGKKDRAMKLFNELYEIGYKKPRVYSSLFNELINTNPEKAQKIMKKGKELFPENIELLFTEINYLLKNKKYEELEKKLKLAIEKDPDNPSVRNALGNVYNNLYSKAIENGEKEKAAKYFNKAIDYFKQTLVLDSSYFDAVYSVGMMYFNKAAALTQEMQGLSLDQQVQYEKLDKQVNELFRKALPYFKKAERLNPNDQNTLIGLREILARMSKLEMSKAVKERLDAIQEGKTFKKSLFSSEN